jgi:uncharacterized protein YndB with AHSA1/START domain
MSKLIGTGMNPEGTLTRISPDDIELVVTRRFDAPIEDVWASVATSAGTTGWYGPFTRDGDTAHVTMVFEDGAPVFDMHIDDCAEPTHVELSSDGMHLELRLSIVDETTELTLVHHLVDAADAALYGPGWEYYLDNLVAARAGADLPVFDGYESRFSEHYAGLAAAF